MKPGMLRVEDEPSVFASLVAALTEAGLRCGWLDLSKGAVAPEGLEAAAATGMLRAVSAVGDRTVVVKPVRGNFVLRDLLREHFRGCRLVLVRGEVDAPVLRATDGGWRVAGPGGDEEALTSEELVTHLRRPTWPLP